MDSGDVLENISKDNTSVPEQELVTNNCEIIELPEHSAFGNKFHQINFKPRTPTWNFLRFLFLLSDHLNIKILKWFHDSGPVNIFFSIDLEYDKPYGTMKKLHFTHKCSPHNILKEIEITAKVEEMTAELLELVSTNMDLKSGLVVSNINFASIHATKISP